MLSARSTFHVAVLVSLYCNVQTVAISPADELPPAAALSSGSIADTTRIVDESADHTAKSLRRSDNDDIKQSSSEVEAQASIAGVETNGGRLSVRTNVPVPVKSSVSNSSTTIKADNKTSEMQEPALTASDYMMYIILDVLLLCGAALFAGLTLGLMGLDSLSLEIVAEAGPEPDRSYATLLLPVRRNGNLLLCTLILGNVMVNTLVAQVTDKFVHGWIGVALSTALITLGGEIIPQAFMSAYALKVGATMTPVVRGFLILFFPICKPLSMFLDKTIGNDPGQVYDRNELRKLMYIHAKNNTHAHGDGQGGSDGEGRKSSGDDAQASSTGNINEGDFALMMGAMDVHEKTVANSMTPMDRVFMLEASERLNERMLQVIWSTGHSRIPVYKNTPTKIVGLLFTKDLIGIQPDEATRVIDVVNFTQRRFHSLFSDMRLVDALQQFQTGITHFAIVKRVVQQLKKQGGDPVYETVGVVTLDDILETLMQSVLKDEFDYKLREDDGMTDDDQYATDPGASSTNIPDAKKRRDTALGGHLLTAATAAIFAKKLRKATDTDDTLTIDRYMNGSASQSMIIPRGGGAVRGIASGRHATARASVLRSLRRVELTENQAKAAAYFLAESLFPDEVKECVSPSTTNSHQVTPTTSIEPGSEFALDTAQSPDRDLAVQVRQLLKQIDSDDFLRLITDFGLSYEVRAPSNARGLSKTSKKNLWLYKKGVPSTAFTLIVGGGVEAILPSSGLMIDEDEYRHQQMMQKSPLEERSNSMSADASASQPTGTFDTGSEGRDCSIGVEDAQPLVMELSPWTNLGQSLLQQAVYYYAKQLSSENSDSNRGEGDSDKIRSPLVFSPTLEVCTDFTLIPDFSARVVQQTKIIQFDVEDFVECCILSKLNLSKNSPDVQKTADESSADVQSASTSTTLLSAHAQPKTETTREVAKEEEDAIDQKLSRSPQPQAQKNQSRGTSQGKHAVF